MQEVVGKIALRYICHSDLLQNLEIKKLEDTQKRRHWAEVQGIEILEGHILGQMSRFGHVF